MKIAVANDGRALVIAEEKTYDVTEQLGLSEAESADPWMAWLRRGGDLAALKRLKLDEADLVDDAQLSAPLGVPGKIVAAPVNYLDHKVEMSEQKTIAEYGVFLKANSSVIGPHGTVKLPYLDKRTDQEGELAVVIGRRARNVRAEDALGYVLGYTGILDITVRSTEDRSTRKSFETFSPLGPWIVSADEIEDPDGLDLRCTVSGEVRQETNTSELIFSVGQLIAYASAVMTLEPGDVIATGTPAGVGPLSDGDTIDLDIEKIGTLSVTVSAADAIAYADRPVPATIVVG